MVTTGGHCRFPIADSRLEKSFGNRQLAIGNKRRLSLRNLYKPRLFISERQMVSAQPELDRIAQGRPANDFDVRAVAEAHLQQTATNVKVAADGNDKPAAADAQLVQGAGFRRPAMITTRKVTCLLHEI
jgi:hypothetical protein